jgi:hypothetical protein
VLGGKELERLATQKQALVAESELNRLALQADFQNLASAAGRMKDLASGKVGPLMMVLGPLGGLLLRRTLQRRTSSWLGRAVRAVKWVGPIFSLWRGYLAGRRRVEAREPLI